MTTAAWAMFSYAIGAEVTFMVVANQAVDTYRLVGTTMLWPAFAFKHLWLSFMAGVEALFDA